MAATPHRTIGGGAPDRLDSFAGEEADWLAAVPGEVDGPAEAARQRIGRIARQFDRVLATVAADHGLSVGDWEALSVLARSADATGAVTPGRMGELLGLTSGTVSARIDRLAQAGLLEAAPIGDGRRRPVRLTDAGRRAWGEATLTRTARESALLRDALTAAELDHLGTLLGWVLARLEAEYGPAPRHDMTRSGAPRRG